jgi:hypothetical protein
MTWNDTTNVGGEKSEELATETTSTEMNPFSDRSQIPFERIISSEISML